MADFETRNPVSKEVADAIDVIASKQIAYCRYATSFGGYVCAYRRDPTSPTGVVLIRGFKTGVWDEAIKITGAVINLEGPR